MDYLPEQWGEIFLIWIFVGTNEIPGRGPNLALVRDESPREVPPEVSPKR